MIGRYSTPIALFTAVATYVVLFVLLGGSAPAVQLLAPAGLAALAGVGVKLMTGRTQEQAELDNYQEDARALADDVAREVSKVAKLGQRIPDAEIQSALERSARTVPELLARVRRDQPSSLYSTASKFRGHVSSLESVVTTYQDLMEHPHYYKRSDQLKQEGKQAILRFDEFAIESMQLLTQGDMASYKANLDTVAPPAIPQLEG